MGWRLLQVDVPSRGRSVYTAASLSGAMAGTPHDVNLFRIRLGTARRPIGRSRAPRLRVASPSRFSLPTKYGKQRLAQ